MLQINTILEMMTWCYKLQPSNTGRGSYE